MSFFKFDIRKIFIVAGLLALPLMSIQLQQRSGKSPWIFQPFLFMSGSSQSFYSSYAQAVKSTTDLYLNLIDIKKDNIKLQSDISKLRLAMAEIQELKQENLRLATLLNFQQQTPMDLLPVRLIGRDALREYQSIMVDRGSDHGVKKGMGVLSSDGAIGYILHAEPTFSQVLLLSDRYAVLDVLVQRSRARGILGGAAPHLFELRYLKRSDDVVIGDVIITSGLDNVFPKGIHVGVVNKVDKTEFGFDQSVEVKPKVSPDHIEEAFIVLNAKNFDFEPLMPKSQNPLPGEKASSPPPEVPKPTEAPKMSPTPSPQPTRIPDKPLNLNEVENDED
jgi:rod shape-determining protein MreC